MRFQSTFTFILLVAGCTFGAPDSENLVKHEDRKDHWSFKPLSQFKADHTIDSFINKKLIANGLSMSPEADRQTWIRRVYFDLIGLTPSPEQVRPSSTTLIQEHMNESLTNCFLHQDMENAGPSTGSMWFAMLILMVLK